MILSRTQRARLQRIARGRSDEALHLLEGRKAVLDALDLGVVEELWMRRGEASDFAFALRQAAAAARVPVGEAAPAELDRLGDTVSPQGVLAVVRDTARALDEVVAAPGMLLWLDRVQDPGNVGAIVRVAVAFGAAGLLVGAGTADPLGLKALRASAGLALRLPFARASGAEIARACAARSRPVWVLEGGGDDLFASVPKAPEDLVLVTGSEGGGVGDAARAAATRSVGIPLAPAVDSLNAAVATGVVMAWFAGGARR